MPDVFKSYSIGKLVDLNEMVYNEKSKTPKTITLESLAKEICHFSMAHFQIGT